jgi:Zn-dependent protease
MNFKQEEIKDLIISVIGLSLLSALFDFKNVLVYAVIYGFSTTLKILAEKYVAKKYDLEAIYSFNYNFFIISLVLSLMSLGALIFPILGFITPTQKKIKRLGKTYSNITISEKGWISLMGILSSVLLIIISLLLFKLNPLFFQKMMDINILILLFSIIPFAKFEGSNILWWNRFLWMGILLCSIFFSFMAIFKINLIISLLFLFTIFILVFVSWENVFKSY